MRADWDRSPTRSRCSWAASSCRSATFRTGFSRSSWACRSPPSFRRRPTCLSSESRAPRWLDCSRSRSSGRLCCWAGARLPLPPRPGESSFRAAEGGAHRRLPAIGQRAFALRRVGRIAQSVLVLVIALRLLAVEWTADKVVLVAVALISGTVIYFAIFVLGATFCFWTVQAKEATHVFTYGGDGLASYPLDIYRGSVRRFFTFVVPLAFVNYEPALYVLGRPDPLGLPDVARLLSPVAALAMAALAWLGWQQGVRHYQSTGS